MSESKSRELSMVFSDEIKNYTDDELQLILETQKDLYSAEEWVQLQAEQSARARIRQEKYDHWAATHLPEVVECEKCDGPNPFEGEVCIFCGHKLDKSKYYTDEYYECLAQEPVGNERADASVSAEKGENYTFHYVISFLIPIVGYIMGAIMLAGDTHQKRTVGKSCIITAIVSTVINGVLISLLWEI